MSVPGLFFIAGVLVAFAAIAAADAKRMTVPPEWLAVLLASGLGWLAAGGLEMAGGSWDRHAAGAAVGLGVPFAMILGAQALGRRWPIYPGDAWLLGAAGTILGVGALLWAMAAGSALALVHRACLQRKRGRPFAAGYLPAGPGLAAGAAAVFVALNAGIALGDGHLKPGPGDPARIEATELLPVTTGLPEALDGKTVKIDAPSPIPFPDLVGRIGSAAGVAVAIEERPSRIAGGRAELPEAAPIAAGTETRLGRLLDDVAARAGYAWEWKEDRAVFYRYWDNGWKAADAAAAGPSSVAQEPVEPGATAGGPFAWLGRLLGGAGEEQRPGEAGEAPAGEATETGESHAPSPPTGDPEPPRQEQDGVAWAAAPEPLIWEVDPADHRTLRGVLEAWADRAEWKVAWRAGRDFSVGAGAIFEGGFLAAVDGLLSDPRISRVLTARAHANRYLVIEEAGR